jgi:hypothetical protein
MSDKLERLRAALADLDRQLRDLDNLDPETRAMLQDAANEISTKLDRAEAAEGDDGTAESKGVLEEKVLEFEASHPEVSLALSRFIDMLGQIGI